MYHNSLVLIGIGLLAYCVLVKAEASSDSCEMLRTIEKVILSRAQREGLGATVRRSIGTEMLRSFDPFLMLDEFNAGLPAAFPDHAHRGFETVSFILPWSKGSFEHEDSKGHYGRLSAGDLQWMTAGKGIVHSEVPESSEAVHGLQLWVNLPKKFKMVEPRYQEMKWAEIPHFVGNGLDVAVISGQSYGVKSPVKTLTPVEYLFVTMEPNSVFEQPIEQKYNVMAVTIKGKAIFETNGKPLSEHNTIVFKQNGGAVRVETKQDPCTFVLLSGEPIGEEVVQYGPVVMNTREEIMEFFDDYRGGKNGFEGTVGWESTIGKKVLG